MNKGRNNTPIADKLFSRWTFFLCLAGLVLNIILARIVVLLQLPFYLDNVGSILVGALGGILPGIIVGFLSNVISSFATPISMYYGLITVVIAYLAVGFSQKGYFKTWRGRFIMVLYCIFWGGVVGSIFSWMLNGGKIGGLAEPYANSLVNNFGLAPFLAQLLVDVIIDIPDKFTTIFLVTLILEHYPAFLYDKFALSYLYDRSPEQAENVSKQEHRHFRVDSLDVRLVRMVVGSIALVSVASVIISSVYHHIRLSDSYANQVANTAKQVAALVDGDKLDSYIKLGRKAEGYADVEKELYKLRNNDKLVKYIFVYKAIPQGVQIAFDLDDSDLPGKVPGTIVDDEQGFAGRLDDFIMGKDIKPEFSSGSYGYLMTGYAPIKDSTGKVVAYAGADIGMNSYVNDMLTFIIQIIAMIFALTMVIAFLALLYLRHQVIHPLSSIMQLLKQLESINPESWLESDIWNKRETIKTGDEIETLYAAICKLEENSAHYVKRIIETEQQLAASKELERVNGQLKEAMAKADEATRVKSEFYSRMSHDMRTPMNGIMGLVNLSEDEQDSKVLHQNLKKIGISSQYLLGLINDTLDMSRMESKKLTLVAEPIHLESFIDNILTMLRPTMDAKQLNFEYEIIGVPKGQVVLGDEMRLNQIFMNLFSNAAKFTPNNGVIKVTMEQPETAEDHVVNRVKISDNGYGMSEEFLAHGIFNAFSQERNAVTSEYAGSGLGLAIVKNLIDLMGGHISVESQLGEGTTFTLILPFKLAKEADLVKKELQDKAAEEQVDLSILKGKTVLLCEDHPLNKEIVIRLLEKKGVKVEHAPNGKIGLELFTASPSYHFAAVLMDIRMPIMNGLEATIAIRKLDREDARNVPIIAMTANAFTEDIAASQQAGMNAHLAKPLNPQLMFKVIAEKIEERRG